MPAVRLDGKVALVTGGVRRVGRAIATELARAGALVVAHASLSSPEEAASLEREFPTLRVLRADLREPAASVNLIDEVRALHGRLDALVNSAASYPRGPFLEQGDDVWRDVLALNLEAPARLVRLGLPLGLAAVVNLVDVAAWQPWKNHAAYSAAKAGLAHLTRCLALELAPSVRVNGVAPGTVAWPPDLDEQKRASILSRIPLARVGAPEDVARAVRFLLEEDYLTGVILPVDGGSALR